MTNSNIQTVHRWDHRHNHAGTYQFVILSPKRLQRGSQVLAKDGDRNHLVWVGKQAESFTAGMFAYFGKVSNSINAEAMYVLA